MKKSRKKLSTERQFEMEYMVNEIFEIAAEENISRETMKALPKRLKECMEKRIKQN